MLISLSLLPEMGSAIPHFTNERITVSFSRRKVSCHAVPTHFVKSKRRSPALSFPLINSSGFADECSVASLSTLVLNSALNATSSGGILLVALGGTSPNVVWHSCARMFFILSVPHISEPEYHYFLLTPSVIFELNYDSKIILPLLSVWYSLPCALEDQQWCDVRFTIGKYGKLLGTLSLIMALSCHPSPY